MAVEEKQMTEEQKQQEKTQRDEAEQKVKDDLFSTLDLPDDEAKEETTEDASTGTEEEVTEETSEETEEQTEEPNEEVIPRAKYDKAVKRQERRIKELTARIKQMESSGTQTTDTDRQKLEKMDEGELKSLKRRVRSAAFEATGAKEREEYLELEDKIDDVMRTAPKRFADKQIAHYNAAVEEIVDDPDIDDIEKAGPEIKRIAQTIYQRYPDLQKLERGQAMALEQATEHYKQINKLSSGKERVLDLKRKNNKLKQKTALDSNALKGNLSKSRLDKIRQKAGRGGTMYDKEALIREDPRFGIDQLIPDEFKE